MILRIPVVVLNTTEASRAEPAEAGARSTEITELVSGTRALVNDPDEALHRGLSLGVLPSIAMACHDSCTTGIWHLGKRRKIPSAFRKLWRQSGLRCRGLNEQCEVIFMAGTDYAPVTDYAAEAVPVLPSRMSRAVIALVRVGVGLLWLQNVGWKIPPDFGRGDPPSGLYLSARYAVTHEVFHPYASLVERVVLPNFTVFGWMVLLVEASLGAFLLIGLATRFWALIGVAQTVVIMLSVLNAPHEWFWSYVLMLLVHLALFATAAGRYAGLDGLLRTDWQYSRSFLARLLVRVS
jgi:thiosulfate dehydrogenase (quinone) large subunit